MGSGLSHPVTNKLLTRLESSDVLVGSAEMQGYRMDMEDDLIIDRTMDESRFLPATRAAERGDGESSAIFLGVFDGHVGAEASKFLANNISDAVKTMPDLKNQTWIDTFMALDERFCATKQSAGSTCVTALLHKDPVDIEAPDTVKAELREKGDCKTMATANGDGSANGSAAAAADKKAEQDGDAAAAEGTTSDLSDSSTPPTPPLADDDAKASNEATDGKSQDDSAGANANGDNNNNNNSNSNDDDNNNDNSSSKSDKMDVVDPSREAKKWNLTVCNVGDSRCLVGRADGTWEAMTKDHKPEDPEEMRRIENAGGHVSWSRVDGQLALSRAFGDISYKDQQHLPADRQKVIAYPDVTRTAVYPGDWVLLCCDGIFEGMSNAQVMHHVWQELQTIYKTQAKLDPAKIMASLLEKSLAYNSKDNMSALLLIVLDDAVMPSSMTTNIGLPSEYFAAPMPHEEIGQQYMQAYCSDAMKYGIGDLRDKLQPMVRQSLSPQQYDEINEFISTRVSGPCHSDHVRDYTNSDRQESKKRKLNSSGAASQ